MIRPVRFMDLPALRTIFEGSFTEEFERRGVDMTGQFVRWQQMYPLVRALSLFPNPYQYTMNLLVAEVDGAIAGFVQTSPGNHQRSRWHIDYLAVAPERRHHGIAGRLVDHVCDQYGSRGVHAFTIEVDTRNLKALGLFAKKGFRQYATLSYYQLSPEALRAHDPAEPPLGLRQYRPKDAAALLELHNACTPASVRLVDSRSVGDFELGFIEHNLSRWRRKLGLSEDLRYVVENDQRQIVGYLRVLGHLRPMPLSLRLMVHPGYEHLLDSLLQFGLGKLRGFPENIVLAWAPDYQAEKGKALEAAGFTLLTADHLLVRDSLLTIRMPLNTAVQKVDEAAFKPAYCEPRS
jgi:ribosomal protein S18 acetylase RimI-like enzyme